MQESGVAETVAASQPVSDSASLDGGLAGSGHEEVPTSSESAKLPLP